MLKFQIINDINDYVGNDDHEDWYVGIATDVEKRLFKEHGVDKERDPWIHREADSESIARDAEAELLYNHGYDGGTGGGDHPIHVYAYKKNSHTRQ